MKMLCRRKAIAYVVFVIASVSFACVYYWNNTRLETRDQPRRSNEAFVNETWTAIRKVRLSEQRVSKVIILAHARGGSTLCSDIFNIEPNNTVLWYEALHGFYSFYAGTPHYVHNTLLLYDIKTLSRRPTDFAKQKELAKYLTQLMTCDFENVPIELIATSPFIEKSVVFKDLYDRMEQVNASARLQYCQEPISKYCYHEELVGDSEYSANYSIASFFKCAEVLQSIRRLKSQPAIQVTINEILRSYFNNQDIDKDILGLTVHRTCPQFADLSDAEQLKPMTNTCLNLASKLNQFIKHDQCLESLHKDTMACRQKMAAPCRRTRLTVAEIQRAFIEDLEPLIQQMPDIHIVHYVRDPRAVSVSRAERHMHTFRQGESWTVMHETYLLCQRMRYDNEHKKRLQQIYPNSIITVRYEDLVLDPKLTVKRMYDFFGRPVPLGLNDWVKRTMNASNDNGMYGIQRSDGKQHLSEWRSSVNVDDMDIMNHQCLDVLREYEYEL